MGSTRSAAGAASFHPGIPRARAPAVYPNPSAGVARLAFSVPKRSTVDLEIFDILGRRIHRWVMKDLEPGRHVVEWDGRDGSGSMIAPGVLIARLHVGNISKAQKFIYRR